MWCDQKSILYIKYRNILCTSSASAVQCSTVQYSEGDMDHTPLYSFSLHTAPHCVYAELVAVVEVEVETAAASRFCSSLHSCLWPLFHAANWHSCTHTQHNSTNCYRKSYNEEHNSHPTIHTHTLTHVPVSNTWPRDTWSRVAGSWSSAHPVCASLQPQFEQSWHSRGHSTWTRACPISLYITIHSASECGWVSGYSARIDFEWSA
jgi:hypothetical protein